PLTAVLLLAFSIFMTLPYDWVDAIRIWYGERTAVFHWTNLGQVSYANGTYAQILPDRAQSFIGRNADGLIYFFGNVLSMFLIGLYAGKRKIFQNIETHVAFLRRVMWSGLVIGVLFNGMFVLNAYWGQTTYPGWYPGNFGWTIHTGTRTVGAPALMLFYVTAITLLLRREKWQERLAPLGPVGRMALSNYLTQSVISTLIFNGYGLGLYGRTSPIFYLILVILIFMAQIRFSAWWLARYQFGPAEWVWRSLTYGRRQSLRHGQKLEDVRPFSWKQRLGLAVIVLGVIGIYGWRNFRPEKTPAEILTVVADNEEAKATPTPIIPTLPTATAATPTPQPTIVPPVVQPVAYKPGPIVANGDWGALAKSFDVNVALQTIEELSGEPYDGRSAGTPGGKAAGDFIADQFAQLGLQPAGVDGFFQPFPIHQTHLDGLPRLTIETADGAVIDDYVLHQDFAPAVRGYLGAGAAEGNVVWANNCARDDFGGINVVGKVVMCRGDWPRAEVGRIALEHGAAALLLLAGPEGYALDFTPVYYDVWVPDTLAIPAFRISNAVAADLMAGSGQTVADLSVNFTSFPLHSRAHLEIAASDCLDCMARNVLGVLPGRNPDLADEVVVISAHYDHLGQAPDGATWAGANDNASGTAVMLEIARSWQAAGFAPQRTVLFAAWDAEEIGLLGSRHFVANPRYPLDKIVGVVNLDMVGAGEQTLHLSGAGLESQGLAVAATMNISATVRDSGRSDHFPFQQAGVTAVTFGWFSGGDGVPSYHRPIDTPDVIEPDKLTAVGQIAGLTALNLADTAPQLDDLLARRAAAIVENDAAAFLATSHPAQRNGDRIWLADVAALAPISATLTADFVRLLGDTATSTGSAQAVANAQLNLIYLETREGEIVTRTLSMPLPARFQSNADGWQWAGANLTVAEQDESDAFIIRYPADLETEATTGVAQFVTRQYATMAALLNLPAAPNAQLILYPTADALRADTALSLPDGTNSWVGPGLVKLVYSGPITSHQQLAASLSQLLLAEAGATETAVPWLWRGLADVVAAESNLETIHRAHLPVLTTTFAADEFVRGAATDWAAADYLQRQLGWEELGQFIVDAGQNGLDAALQSTLNLSAAQFETAWRTDWENRLAAAETAVNRILSARADAVFTPNRAAFLGTIDESAPLLTSEENDWFDSLGDQPPISYSLTEQLLTLHGDGRILANITQVYEPAAGRGGTTQRDILFIPGENGLRWAGSPVETLGGDFVTVVYSPGQLEAAEQFLALADSLIPQLPAYLTTDYETIRLPANLSEGSLALAQRQLERFGVTDEWLLEGTAVYLAAQLDDQIEQSAAANLHSLWSGIENNRIGGIANIPAIMETGDDKARKTAVTQAWDTIRYLTLTYGEAALERLLRAQADGQSIEAAL
ncbi:MAG: M20/M25/M40 family metallo-hydrolase, partial [Chloroflexi bacterium]|nr:M20/M25/M40 family metallo-hydrolase [Chloroflexota bacterium]